MTANPTEWCAAYADAWSEMVDGDYDRFQTLDQCYVFCQDHLHEDPADVARRHFAEAQT
jgi:hypothetical protein